MEPTQPQPIAIWNPARDVWERPDSMGLFCEHLAVFSETFPLSGTTRGGMASALPTWAQHTTDSGSSSSPSTPVPTPSVADAMGGHLTRSGARSNELLLPGVAKSLALPTPTVSDAKASGGSTPSDVTLTDLAVRMDFGAQQNPRHL